MKKPISYQQTIDLLKLHSKTTSSRTWLDLLDDVINRDKEIRLLSGAYLGSLKVKEILQYYIYGTQQEVEKQSKGHYD